MESLLSLIFIICLIALSVGIIAPLKVIRWGTSEKRKRINVIKFYGSGLVLSLMLLVVFFSKSNSQTLSKDVGNLIVHFIDVGQADTILIENESSAMLIDGGNNNDSELVVNYIKSQGIKKIDYVIGTHPQEDHIGGLDAVINTFEIGKVIMPNVSSNTKTFEDVLLAINYKNLKITSPKVGDTYTLNNAQFTIMAPNKTDYNDVNDASIVVKLQYKNSSFIFLGDAEKPSELQMLKLGNLKSDVIKIGHHGSNSSTTIDFLKAVSPKYAVITVGKDNTYGHPSDEVLDRLKKQNIEILRTDLDGTIVFTTDGENLSFVTTKH